MPMNSTASVVRVSADGFVGVINPFDYPRSVKYRAAREKPRFVYPLFSFNEHVNGIGTATDAYLDRRSRPHGLVV